MTDDSPYTLQQVSVVVTAEFHNPSILNPDFLVSREIVPGNWNVIESLTTPAASVVGYDNGVRWLLDKQKLNIIQAQEARFGDEHVVHGLAERYLTTLPHGSYRSLGLNCTAYMKQAAADEWLMERLLKPGAWLAAEPAISGMTATFRLDAGDAVCNLTFGAGHAESTAGVEESIIVIDVNVHHQGPLVAGAMCSAIERWPAREGVVIAALNNLLTGAQP